MPVMVSKQVGDLTNAIHAIFRRSNFENISDSEYDALAPTLRLATRLLTTKEIAGFPHAILLAPFGYRKGQSTPDQLEIYDEKWFQRKWPKLTEQDIAKYETTLSTFANMVSFRAVNTSNQGCGYCNADWSTPPPQGIHLKVGSTIAFSKKDVDKAMIYQNTWSELASQRHCFITAKILLHELMHALAYARVGHDVAAPFDIPFEKQTIIETGYEWEDYVFGGLVYWHTSAAAGSASHFEFGALYHSCWPSAGVARQYIANDYEIVILEQPAPIEVHWLVDPNPSKKDWVSRLFSTHFWEHEVPRLGASALKAPKIRGFRYDVDEEGKTIAVADPFSLPADTIPTGYIQDDLDGEVVIDLW